MTEELEPGVGQGDPQDDGLADEPIAEESSPSVPQPAQEQPDIGDLTQHPKWREAQSKYDKRIAQLEAEIRQREQQEIASLSQVDQNALAQMDEYQQKEYLLQHYQRKATYYEQRDQRREVELARQNALRSISQQYSVPEEILEEATDYNHAETLAMRYQLQQMTKSQAQQQQQEKQQDLQRRNNVDVGGSPPRSEEASFRARLREATKRNDHIAWYQIKREAAERGYAL